MRSITIIRIVITLISTQNKDMKNCKDGKDCDNKLKNDPILRGNDMNRGSDMRQNDMNRGSEMRQNEFGRNPFDNQRDDKERQERRDQHVVDPINRGEGIGKERERNHDEPMKSGNNDRSDWRGGEANRGKSPEGRGERREGERRQGEQREGERGLGERREFGQGRDQGGERQQREGERRDFGQGQFGAQGQNQLGQGIKSPAQGERANDQSSGPKIA